MNQGLSPADYYEQTLVSGTAVSPGGDRVAFTAREFDANEEESLSSLFVVPADGSREPHRLTRIPGVSSPTWSPDGSKLGFLAGRDADVGLRAATSKEEETDGAGEDEETNGAGEDEETDGAGDGDDKDDGDDGDDGDDHGAEEQQVWVLDLDRGGEPRQVTTREEGVASFDWGPEGERIVVASRDPTEEEREYLEDREDDGPIEVERLQHKANGRGWLDGVTTYLFVVDVESREERRLDDAYAAGAVSALAGDGMQPAWAPGDRIAFVANHEDGADDSWALDLFTIDPGGGAPTRVTSGEVRVGSPAWSPGGERLGFSAAHPTNNHVPTDIRVVTPGTGGDDERGTEGDDECGAGGDDARGTGDDDERGTGGDDARGTGDDDRYADDDTPATEDVVLTDGLDRTATFGGWLGEDSVLGVVGNEGQTRLYDVGLDGERADLLPGQDASFGIGRGSTSTDADSGTAAFVGTGPNEREVYRVACAETGARRLTECNGDLLARSDLTCERVRFESDPGVEVEGITYHAAGASPENRPLIVNIHGGPMAYDEPSYSFRYHYWAGEGYVILEVNYRGSTSYGRAFSESIRGDWGPREARDVAAGVECLVDRGWVDPDRVFVTGFSQGGVNTAFVLEETDVATAGAAEHGVYDFLSAFGTDDSHVWWENDFGLPWEDPESYYGPSSITDVGEIEAPLLVTAGEEDWRCPPSQAEQLYVSVTKRGVPAKLVVYPGVAHEYGGPDVATHRIETVTDWFREHDPAVEPGSDGDDDGAEP